MYVVWLMSLSRKHECMFAHSGVHKCRFIKSMRVLGNMFCLFYLNSLYPL